MSFVTVFSEYLINTNEYLPEIGSSTKMSLYGKKDGCRRGSAVVLKLHSVYESFKKYKKSIFQGLTPRSSDSVRLK